jgi:hypothetical protein
VRKANWLRDIALVAVGALAGYFYAALGRKPGMIPALPQKLPPAATGLPARFEAYYRTHQAEVIVGAVLVGIILYLAFGRGGGKKRR